MTTNAVTKVLGMHIFRAWFLSLSFLLLSWGDESLVCWTTNEGGGTGGVKRSFLAVVALAPRKKRQHVLSEKKVYRYFGYGSNVLPSTMKALRQIDVREAETAILPHYDLRFYGSSNKGSSSISMQIVETSAAYIEPSVSKNLHVNNDKPDKEENGAWQAQCSAVHGVLYTLTDQEFAKVGCTEGVPFAYRWQRCHVYTYKGDGKSAGYEAMSKESAEPLEAYTLVAPRASNQQQQEVPPSASYLGLIKEGARLWKFDQSYQEQLDQVGVASNLWIAEGISELVLRWAEQAIGLERTYKIGVSGTSR